MSTIVIRTPDDPQEFFEVDLANEPKEFAEEFRKFVSKLRGKKQASAKQAREELSPKLQRASEYLRSLENVPESIESLREADELRKAWIRKYD